MPVPPEYQRASQHFEAFMANVCAESGLATTHMAWNMVVGVLQAFRRRLPLKDALRFANALPPVVRAIYVSDWDPDEPIRPFGEVEAMTREVKALRAAHNFSTDTAIREVAAALRRHVDVPGFEAMLNTLPPEARTYWQA